jgi:hypothetical protein
MDELFIKWTRPERRLRRLEIPVILTICAVQFCFAFSILDATVWRVATVIPFGCAAIALFAGIYVAVRHTDDWS